MTRDAEIKSINCTSCGAGLDVHGGGRVLAHVCSYCGAELDAVDNYKVLAKFEGLQRPGSPLRIGMRGQIEGVEYTVIGTLGMEERYHGQVWNWVEHQIFSPTHGYAWLTWESGHLVFTRKYRGEVSPGWVSSAQVERAEGRPSVNSRGVRFGYYETSDAAITFAEGEFNWRPRIGDRTTTVSMLADGAMLDFVDSGNEREVELTHYLPQAETLAAFGAEPRPKAPYVHAVQPVWRYPDDTFLLVAGLVFAVVSLFGALILGFDDGREVLPAQQFALSQLPAEVSFDLTDTEKLALIQLYADVDNSWTWLEASLTDPEDQPVFEVGREIGYYSGYDDGNWTEGSRWATVRFHPPAPGTYTLEIAMAEAETWERSGSPLSRVGVTVSEGAKSGFWLVIAAGLLMLPGLLTVGGRLVSRRRRWQGSDWVEEDEDDD
ncbi:hypothetical protein ATO6_04410 [Oceanicola sp. 22II-s10i]|uniref:DUF4178 domain-containing protein n=1 Tax=Oceanicola sp. 22II-s10i TaxID=1317116 RepID=UPI000B5245BE|nr:DUF4178 domain-containing protein [Oceanicola sp. 22II-s10i]OWU86108.1 hypothetical protein ATO6_04410 [Oceanicola sp. 22II-s10i]